TGPRVATGIPPRATRRGTGPRAPSCRPPRARPAPRRPAPRPPRPRRARAAPARGRRTGGPLAGGGRRVVRGDGAASVALVRSRPRTDGVHWRIARHVTDAGATLMITH